MVEVAATTPWQMWVTLALIGVAIVAYSISRIPIELTSIAVVAFLLVFFEVFPVFGLRGQEVLDTETLLSGFANPALVAVLALLVVGQGLFHTGALEGPTREIVKIGRSRPRATIFGILLIVAAVSAFLNNTPVAVIFIPVLAAVAAGAGMLPGRVMMPLSFMCILGGMTTLIGSSTNLLVAGTAARNGFDIGFFEFTVPGLVLAGVGALYVLFLAPRFLPRRGGMDGDRDVGAGRQFITEIHLGPDHPLIGKKAVSGMFPDLPNVTVRMIQRREEALLPPFDDIVLHRDDVLILAATRRTLTELLASRPGILKGFIGGASIHPGEAAGGTPPTAGGAPAEAEKGEKGAQRLPANLLISEAVIAPGSRMIGSTLGQVGFYYQTGCIVLGIQRRSRMIRAHMHEIRLEAGDVLLVLGRAKDIQALRVNRDVLLLEWSAKEVPNYEHAGRALVIFTGVIFTAATGILPIATAALLGAGAMIATRCLNIRQAARAIDRRIFLLIGAALAMAAALQATRGAEYLAMNLVDLTAAFGVPVALSALFLLIAILTNVLSNNAAAVLFTPIAIETALDLNADPMIFIFTVIFAANCSFVTPIGYQTNLLVMSPGRYTFADFLRVGTPLLLILWVVYSFFAPWYFGL